MGVLEQQWEDLMHPTIETHKSPTCKECGEQLPTGKYAKPHICGWDGANSTQVGGDHYRNKKIQPWDYIHGNGIGYLAGCVIKYVSRYGEKGGVEDLKKARHFLDKLIEEESAK